MQYIITLDGPAHDTDDEARGADWGTYDADYPEQAILAALDTWNPGRLWSIPERATSRIPGNTWYVTDAATGRLIGLYHVARIFPSAYCEDAATPFSHPYV